MPFDGDPKKYGLPSTYDTKPDVVLLDAVIERLRDPANWCHDGPINGDALCIVATVGWATEPYARNSVLHVINAASSELFPARTTRGFAHNFNDHPDTTHADVMRVLHRARALLASR